MNKRCNGSICIFLALVLLLITALMFTMLESAYRAAAGSYAQILLKTATESVMGDYCGPLFSDYHILAIDSGFGNTSQNLDELEGKLKLYMCENVWGFQNESVNVTEVHKLMDETGSDFLKQCMAYEKYATVEDVLNEVLSRIKNLGNQKELTKVMERKMDIENELSVIDKCTTDLMKIVDGVNLTLGVKTSSMLGYRIEESFIKKFFVGGADMNTAGINNPSVYEKLKEKYVDPLKIIDEYLDHLKENRKTLEEIEDDLNKYEEAEKEINTCNEQLGEISAKEEILRSEIKVLEEFIEECQEKIKDSEKLQDKKEAEDIKKNYTQKKTEAENGVQSKGNEMEELVKLTEGLNERIKTAKSVKDGLTKRIEEARKLLTEQVRKCNESAKGLNSLFSGTKDKLSEVMEIVKLASETQKEVRPMVEEYEDNLKKMASGFDEDTKEGLEETLNYMKAYVGMGNGAIKTTDFYSVSLTAGYDLEILGSVDMSAFSEIKKDVLEEINGRIEKAEMAKEQIAGFSFNGFSFDYSQIKESTIENKLIAEFESNVSDGYLKLFLKPDTVLSENAMLSELLPSEWFEIEKNKEDDLDCVTSEAEEKGGGAYLSGSEEGSGISDLGDLLGSSLETVGKKLLSAMYMEHHFKSFTDKEVTGDTVLDYEIEYILSGFETDKANLSAAVTKIMLMRLAVSTIYTLTNKNTRAKAQTLATSIMGFTGLPFLITIVKYLILFLWAAAQAVIETAAILRGKKVPIITNDESFCLELSELPAFASLVDEKAENFKESPVYLDYDNYLLILLMIQGEKKQAARAMDIIQENIRYKYDEDFLMSNAITGFSCSAEFLAPSKYAVFLSGIGEPGAYFRVRVKDSVAY